MRSYHSGHCYTDWRFSSSDYLRPIAPSHLNTILELLLNALVSLSLSPESAPVEDLLATLEEEHEIKRDVARQAMSWFGELTDQRWKMDVKSTVREIGLGILRAYKASTCLVRMLCRAA